MPRNFVGRKKGSKNKQRRPTRFVGVEKKSRQRPRKDLTREEFAIMKERLKRCSASEASLEPVLGAMRSTSSFLKVSKMAEFESRRKGSSPVWSDWMVQRLIQKIEEEPSIKLSDMVKWGVAQGFPEVSQSTLHKYLDLRMITYKIARVIPFARNSEACKTARQEYAAWLSANFGQHQVYMDECGFNLWTAPKHGRALSGKTPHIVVSSQQGRNQSLILAISSKSSVVHWDLLNGSVNTASFNTFFEELQQKLAPFQKTVSIFDNCPIHNRDDLTQRLLPGHELKFLPPYSPFFNPVENCFNWIKNPS